LAFAFAALGCDETALRRRFGYRGAAAARASTNSSRCLSRLLVAMELASVLLLFDRPSIPHGVVDQERTSPGRVTMTQVRVRALQSR